MKNPNCDVGKCSAPEGEVRVLPTGPMSNLHVCQRCYQLEMKFRRGRIRDGVNFDLPKWEELIVHNGLENE